MTRRYLTREEQADLLKRLEDLAMRTRSTVEEIDYAACMEAQADFDPLPPIELGDPFSFTKPMVSLLPGDDFSFVHPNVPEPDAEVRLLEAFDICRRDLETLDRAWDHRDQLPIGKLWLVVRLRRDWLRFLSVRHPNDRLREHFAKALPVAERTAEHFQSWATAQLRKRGIYKVERRYE
jgi:hypothetical protein